MHISLIPQRPDASRPAAITVRKIGDVLTIEGEAFDFSSLPDGATIPVVPCHWISGPVERVGGSLHLSLLLPCAPEFAGSELPPLIDPPDGLLDLPDLYPAPEPDPTDPAPENDMPVYDDEEPANVDA
jgi:hypothetical protein